MPAMCRFRCRCAPTWLDSRELESVPENGSCMLVTSGATCPESRAQSFVRAGATGPRSLRCATRRPSPSILLSGLVRQGGSETCRERRDRGTEFLPAIDAEGERHARQPLLRVHRRIARAADEHAPVSRWFKPSHGRSDPWRHLSQRSVEHDVGGELPPGAQIPFHCCHRVEAVGRIEPVGGLLDRTDPVDPIGADRVSAMGVTQEVPAPVADDDRPGVHLGLPLVAGLAPIRDQHATPGRDGSDECAGGGGSGRAEYRSGAADACSRSAAACRPTLSGSARMTLPRAEPTRSSTSAAAGWPSSTAMTRPSASCSVKTTGGSLVPRPSRYPPWRPRVDSTGTPASRRMPTYRRAARSVTPKVAASSSAVTPGRFRRISMARRARAVGLESVGTRAD